MHNVRIEPRSLITIIIVLIVLAGICAAWAHHEGRKNQQHRDTWPFNPDLW